MFVFTLFNFKLVEEATIFGIKLKLTPEQLLLLMPIVISVPYFLVNNSVRNIARIVNLLLENSKEIVNLNKDARPFKSEDLDFQSQGIAGIQLQFSKWIVSKYLTKRNFKLTVELPKNNSISDKVKYTFSLPFKLWQESNKLIGNLLRTSLWVLFLVSIYILPLVVSIWILYNARLEVLFIDFKLESLFNNFLLIAIYLVGLIFYTLISNLLLYSLYFSELLELKRSLNKDALNRIYSVFKRIGNYYKKKKTDNTI